MKKLTSTLGVFAAAAAIAAAFAMSPAPAKAETNTSNNDDPHWFQLGSGNYIDQDSQANKQTQCGTPQTMDCVVGYEEYDFENDEPISDAILLRGNKQLQ